MTNWLPLLAGHPGPRYRAIADALAEDVRQGTLAPGTRLPTHRELAWRLRVTIGTVSRAYAEAERRGLIAGEVGRGTFVRSPKDVGASATGVGTSADFIELGINRPRAPSEAPRLAAALAHLSAASDLPALLDYQPHAGRLADRAAGARWLARFGLAVPPEEVIVTAGAQHAMACALGAAARPGDTLAVEALTYPGIKTLASLMQIRLVPIAMDAEGMLPDALAAACRASPLRAAYILPTLHNPTTGTLSLERRHALVDCARHHDLTLIEDDVYGFLCPAPPAPLTALAPERSFYLTSTSKSLVPGLRIGYLRAPAEQVERVAMALRSTTYLAPPLMAQIASGWIDDGTADALVTEKRAEAERRFAMLRRFFAEPSCRGDPAACHVWLTLPEHWSAEEFAAAAFRRGVGITPAAAFAVGRQAPNAVRVCIGMPASEHELERGLARLAELLATTPEPYLSVV